MSPSANASAVAACTAAGSLPGASSPPVVLLPAAAVLAIADEVLVVVALDSLFGKKIHMRRRANACAQQSVATTVRRCGTARNWSAAQAAWALDKGLSCGRGVGAECMGCLEHVLW